MSPFNSFRGIFFIDQGSEDSRADCQAEATSPGPVHGYGYYVIIWLLYGYYMVK
jgi:hypothetical protein